MMRSAVSMEYGLANCRIEPRPDSGSHSARKSPRSISQRPSIEAHRDIVIAARAGRHQLNLQLAYRLRIGAKEAGVTAFQHVKELRAVGANHAPARRRSR